MQQFGSVILVGSLAWQEHNGRCEDEVRLECNRRGWVGTMI